MDLDIGCSLGSASLAYRCGSGWSVESSQADELRAERAETERLRVLVAGLEQRARTAERQAQQAAKKNKLLLEMLAVATLDEERHRVARDAALQKLDAVEAEVGVGTGR